MQPEVTVIEYGMGNVGSIANMLKKAGAKPQITSSPQIIAAAKHLILPGVGAFDNAMSRLTASGITDAIHSAVHTNGAWLLGICLGMQLLGNTSEEGELQGLGLIQARTVRFPFPTAQTPLRVPHMGWNEITPSPQSLLLNSTEDDKRYYFVHSYHVVCQNSEDVAATTFYGIPFTSAVQHQRILGVQFHPEKSHRYGMQVLRNFAELTD
jgi:glutamine amidotransferase